MPQAIAGGGQICEMNGSAAVVACVLVTGMCVGSPIWRPPERRRCTAPSFCCRSLKATNGNRRVVSSLSPNHQSKLVAAGGTPVNTDLGRRHFLSLGRPCQMHFRSALAFRHFGRAGHQQTLKFRHQTILAIRPSLSLRGGIAQCERSRLLNVEAVAHH